MLDSSLNFRLRRKGCALVVVLGVINLLVALFYFMGYSNGFSPNLYIQTQTRIETDFITVTLPPEDIGHHDLNNSFVTLQTLKLHDIHLPNTTTTTTNNTTTTTTTSTTTTSWKKLEKCPDPSPHLVGPLRVEFSTPVSLDTVRKENPGLQEGGRYKPHDCVALQKVALIIPFRLRDEHLKFWLYYLHPILQRQQLDYGVYVINQDGDNTFNRAKLMNIGYAEALKEYDYDCFVFSDVDLIPMDDRNTYKCFRQPRHLSVSMDKFGFKLPYNQYFGGVSALSKEQFLEINGFPNNYWGWGGEDDDIFNRVSSRGMSISRPDSEVGKCRMIRHERDKLNDPNPQRFDRIQRTRLTMNTDGINSLKYEVVKVEKDPLFTKITVDVGKP
ncbi:beta-1,4-galactosyltransferase 1-like isoform X1 [Oncorhynchus keta]|uniref:beta-1,4-galactosyltransferase 1-like isoform X1 n=1 Tax=Oncorhynchus keta TaxID=8018 RepID=UPI00227BFD18|nr:beta-1,4-galactosyltransferase 1-like isoform X1 [Oncorhynchus keta]